MVDTEGFKKWLKENSSYSEAVIGDMASRVKRADGIIEWYDEDLLLPVLRTETAEKA